MKLLSTLLLTLVISFAWSQENKVQRIDTIALTDQVDYMRKCMRRSYNSYSYSLTFRLLSIAPLTIGAVTIGRDQQLGTGAFIVGGVLNIAAFIFEVNSRRWIGKSGIGLSPEGRGVVYRFK